MAKLAKILIMLVRLIWLVELGLGIWIASTKGLPYLKLHIGLGFALAFLLIPLAMIAASRKLVVPVVLGCAFAILLPWIGLKQFPIYFDTHMRPIQYAHIAVALLAIGVAEFMHSAIRKHAS